MLFSAGYCLKFASNVEERRIEWSYLLILSELVKANPNEHMTERKGWAIKGYKL